MTKYYWSLPYRVRWVHSGDIGNSMAISKTEMKHLKGKPLSHWKEFIKEKRKATIYAMELLKKDVDSKNSKR